MAVQYVGSTKWTAVTAWASATSYSIGDLRRQLASPTVGNERVFRCTTAGVSGVSEPTWTLTAGSTTSDGTAVWTEVTGQSTYGWTAPHARIANAFASGWMAAGDTLYISNNHAETQASAISLVSPGTPASPCICLCVSDSAAPPTSLSTTATVSTTLSGSNVTFSGFGYIYGVTFNLGGGANIPNCGPAFGVSAAWWWKLESCALKITATGTFNQVTIGTSNASVPQFLELTNTSILFSNVSQGINAYCPFRWSNTPNAVSSSGSAPTILFLAGTTRPGGIVELFGLDLSFLGSGKSLISVASANSVRFDITNCKLGASVSLTTGTHVGQSGPQVFVTNCDSGNTNYKYSRIAYQGNIDFEGTIVRTGGASDGTTAMSRKMVSSANSKFFSQLVSDPIYVWNETTSSITATVEVITDNVTLTNADAWISVEYLGTSGFPQSTFANNRASDILAAPANQTTSTATWTTTGLTTPVKQKLQVTFTPVSKGPIRVKVVLAKPSITMYFCPKVDVA